MVMMPDEQSRRKYDADIKRMQNPNKKLTVTTGWGMNGVEGAQACHSKTYCQNVSVSVIKRGQFVDDSGLDKCDANTMHYTICYY
ncbi:hypothetical protein E2C01_022338 [Portunus trituberculatus]|uniref:Uncharacterized protein n=1 Tax=Portunus trituberculatus TaxID=210409 RepID=A0A5B7E537_PORTR|nr:hypothetical protein [Portunus trituberculatus]